MTASPRRIVIAGGGPAAASAAAALRDRGYEGMLTLASGEQVPPYSRPPLSKAFLAGDATADELRLGTGDADVRLGDPVVAVDDERRRLRLASGEELPYDGLVVATGTRAARPDDEGVHVLETLPDAERLARALGTAGSAVVVGSGVLAFELASAVRRRGLEVTLVSRPGALQRRLGVLAAVLESLASAHGVRLRRGTGRFEGARIVLDDGETLEADLVAAALGGIPNDRLLPRHRAPGGGILVDACNRVAPGIVAAGDVAVRARGDAGLVRDLTWTNALAQGDAAAAALLDDTPARFDPVPYGWTEAFGTEIKVAGAIPLQESPEVVDGSLAEGRALLRWSTGAAAVGYRIPIGRLRRLAADVPLDHGHDHLRAAAPAGALEAQP